MTWKRTVCPHDCPDACGILARVDEGGKVVEIKGDPEHPFTRGGLCGKVNRYGERLYSPYRVLHPMRRIGDKGAGRFERISWDEALDEIAGRLQEIIRRHGGESILPYAYAGTMGRVQMMAGHRFFHRIGASRLYRTICSSCAGAAHDYTFGINRTSDPESVVESDMVVVWGMNCVATNIHGFHFMREAQRRGARLWVVDVYRTKTAALADEFVQVRPGTDAALALGMMHVLISEDLLDHDYIAGRTHGFERLKPHVLEHYSPEKASAITGVPVESIIRMGRAYGKARAPFIRSGYGYSRHTNGGMNMRAVACLPGLVGAFRKRGGGYLQSTWEHAELDMDAVTRPDLMSSPTRSVNMVLLGDALLEADPPIMGMYVYNSNPAAVAPDQKKVTRGLRREDLFLAVHEQLFTDTTDYADIVLPATTSFEHPDLYQSYGHLYLQMAQPVTAPVGEAKSNLEVFNLLARRMGLSESVFTDSEEDVIRQALRVEAPAMEGVTYEKLQEGKAIRVNRPVFFDPFADGFPTPSGKLEFHSDQLEARRLPPLPTYVPGVEGFEKADAAYDLQLVTPPSQHFLNSSFGGSITSLKLEEKPRLKIHPEDASRRGIEEGRLVRVFSRRGEILLFAEVTDQTARGVVVSESVWWSKQMPGGKGINTLTSQYTSDLGDGGTFHESLVGVAPYSESSEFSVQEG
ncbi:MAG: molybdopterin oxidoreductase family protein [Armatimonadetes bacterium]|nr:molybdopterin oxidoreductase family protein [Armatimonadota bacterium]